MSWFWYRCLYLRMEVGWKRGAEYKDKQTHVMDATNHIELPYASSAFKVSIEHPAPAWTSYCYLGFTFVFWGKYEVVLLIVQRQGMDIMTSFVGWIHLLKQQARKYKMVNSALFQHRIINLSIYGGRIRAKQQGKQNMNRKTCCFSPDVLRTRYFVPCDKTHDPAYP